MAIRKEKHDLIIYPKIRKELSSIFVGTIMVFIGVFIALSRIGKNSWIFLVPVGTAVIIFFGLSTIYTIYRIIIKRPYIVINDRGIFESSSAVGVGFIEWSEIKDVVLYHYWGQEFIGIVPYDLEEVLSRCSKIKKFFIRINKKIGYAPINIAAGSFQISLEELYNIIMTAWSRGNRV